MIKEYSHERELMDENKAMTDINERLCRKLGLPWHEHKTGRNIRKGWQCSCGAYNCMAVNHNFTDDTGAVELLRIMMGRGDWGEFFNSLENTATIYPGELLEDAGNVYFSIDVDLITHSRRTCRGGR